jgi:hypothetical protein
MTESKLNPFDAELLVMIGDIAKSQPEVEEKPDRYRRFTNRKIIKLWIKKHT